MKYLLISLLIFVGCKNQKEPGELQLDSYEQTDSVVKAARQLEVKMSKLISSVEANRDSLAKSSPHKSSEYDLMMYERMRSITSYAQFARRYFTVGSTSAQVRSVQGYPNDVIQMGNLTEVWFYGNCEITVYNGLVSKVNYDKGCLNYVDIATCLNAADDAVSKNMHTVIDEWPSRF